MELIEDKQLFPQIGIFHPIRLIPHPTVSIPPMYPTALHSIYKVSRIGINRHLAWFFENSQGADCRHQ